MLFCTCLWKHAIMAECCAGAKYELPKYVLSEPSNLKRSKKKSQEMEMGRPSEASAEAGSAVSMPAAAGVQPAAAV